VPLSAKASGKRLGIFGLGHIGRAVARRAGGFAMPIAYCEPHPVAEVGYRFVPDLKTLAEESDFLVVAASGGAATHNLVDRPVLDALGPADILINAAHGSIVDEAALAENPLAGEGSAYSRTNRRCQRRCGRWTNIVLQPHQASATVESGRAMADLVLANLSAHFAGRGPVSPVV
jgi:hydroxypyruvate reductase